MFNKIINGRLMTWPRGLISVTIFNSQGKGLMYKQSPIVDCAVSFVVIQ